MDGLVDLRQAVAASDQVVGEPIFLDVAVVVAVSPIAEVAIVEFISEQGDATGPANKARKTRQKNVRQKNKDWIWKFFIFLSHIFLSGLLLSLAASIFFFKPP